MEPIRKHLDDRKRHLAFISILLAVTAAMWIAPASAQVVTIQENSLGFCGVEGTVDSNHSGFTGSGFANTNNATGVGVDWTVSVPASGNYALEWRYANASTNNRPGTVRVNGSSVVTVNFPSTGAWSSWTVVSANIALNAGANAIRLQANTNEGLGNIDSLSVTGNNPQPAECGGGSSGCGFAPGLSTGRHSLTVNGLRREYIIDIPSNYNANNRYRLVFGWHPLNGRASDIAQGNYHQLKGLSNGTAVFVAPDRYVSPTGQDDAGWPNTNGRDMDFLRAMLNEFDNKLCIDPDRIFSVGFSYGGMMSFAVGREMGDVFRAIAPMSGALWTPHTNRGFPIAAWIAHGTGDTFVGYNAGVDAKNQIVAANQCSNNTVPTNPSPCVEYQGCRAGEPVVWCPWNGGHSPPSFNYPAAVWNFFSRF